MDSITRAQSESGKRQPESSTRSRNHHGAERIVRPEISRVGADMNVTPLIDILLVLLVIFMAALPATQKGLDVNLPPAQSKVAVDSANSDVVVTVDADRRVSINHQDVATSDLENVLRKIFDSRREKTLYIIAAGTLRYGVIVQVIDAARGAGVRQVGIVTDRMRQSRG